MIATGRTRTVTVEGDINAIGMYDGIYSTSTESFTGTIQSFSLSLSLLGTLDPIATFALAGSAVIDPSGPFGVAIFLTASASCGDGSDSDAWNFGTNHDTSGSHTYNAAGNYSLAVETEEFFDTGNTLFINPDNLSDDNYPQWGGTASKRGCPVQTIQFFEKVVSATFNVSVSGYSWSYTWTPSVGSGPILEYGHGVGGSTYTYSTSSSCPNGLVSITIDQDGNCGFNWEYDASESTWSNHADTFNGLNLTTSGQVIQVGGDSYNTATATANMQKPVKYKWHLKNYRYSKEMNQALTWQLSEGMDVPLVELDVTGSATREFQLDSLGAFADLMFNGNALFTDTYSLHNIFPVCAWSVKPDSLVGIGEQPTNWRPWIHGKLFDAFDITHDQVHTMSGTSTTGWSAGANTSLATGVQLTVASTGTGSATRTWGTPFSGEAYRYLRLQVRSVGSANVPFSVELDGRTWHADTGADGSWVDVEIDMCCATEDSWTVDTCKSRWPVDWNYVDGEPGLPNSTTPAWGVNQISSMVIGDIPASTVFEIKQVALYRKTFCEASFVADLSPEFLAWEVEDENETYAWDNIYACTDGRCMDLPDQYHVKPVGGPSFYYYTHYTINEEASLFVGVHGFTVTYGGGYTYPDDYHNDSLFAFFLGGAGVLVEYSGSPSWTVQDHISLVNGTVQAQALWDWVEVYPDAGDVFGGTSYSSPTPLAVHWIGRGRTQGIVYTENSEPNPGLQVTSSPDVGTGNTDAQGCYFTDTRFAQEGESVTWKPYVASTNTASGAHHDGGEMRICWREGVPEEVAGGVSYDVAAGQRHYVAWVSEGGYKEAGLAIQVLIDDNALALTKIIDTEIEAEKVYLRVKKKDKKIFLLLWYVLEGVVYRTISEDEGENWTMPETIGSGTQVAGLVCDDGRILTYLVDGDEIKVKIEDADFNELQALTVVMDSVDDASISVDESVTTQGKHRFILWAILSGSVNRFVSTDGKTYA